MTWTPDRGNPYGRPARGNADVAWRRLMARPCPRCGATGGRLTVDRDRLTVHCIADGRRPTDGTQDPGNSEIRR